MKNYFKASSWKGGQWLVFLCVFQLLLVAIYVLTHLGKKGHEYVQLDKKQAEVVNSMLLMYTDKGEPSSILKGDTSKKKEYQDLMRIRQARDTAVMIFLESAYDGDIDGVNKATVRRALLEFNTKDCATYLANLKLKVRSHFWLSGGKAYYETIFWCLLGVFTSLIFYVGQKITPASEETFDTDEISNQVAKMFYAPITTMVLVIGYHMVGDGDSNMIDITVNKGVILFSFIAGFYSGRVMKLLDKIKDLILPMTTDAKTTAAKETVKVQVSVKLSLAESLARSSDGAEITEAGFYAAEVTLTPEAGGEKIHLTPPEEEQGNIFSGKEIKPGKYKLSVQYAHKKEDGSAIVNLEAEQLIDIQKNEQEIAVILDRADHDG